MGRNYMKTISLALLLVLATACGNESTNRPAESKSKPPKKQLVVPVFNADSAYAFVKAQVDFGPRTPNSEAHKACGSWLAAKMKSYGAEVMEQRFKARSFDGKVLDGNNIIASFNPAAQKRILLCAHWDSRPFADHDPDPANHHKPIDGANDGASGVGVLMEIARQIQQQPMDIGIDIIFFDLEDYGQPVNSDYPQKEDTWCLGSQYWAQSPDPNGGRARFGILLDMVGAKDAVFTKEYFSMKYASGIVEKVWSRAAQLGYSEVFVNREAGAVTDDHVYINEMARIPTIDIIHYNEGARSGFFPYWHTVNDNMDAIDPVSLRIVGEVLLNVIYNE